MAPTRLHIVRRTAAAALACLASACATFDIKEQTLEQTTAARKGPEGAPFRSDTGFSDALRCMDGLMIDYGVRDISTLVEEIADQTKKVNAGTRDMLITALSEMTRRGRAMRVVAYGRDASNAISFLDLAQTKSPYGTVPQFDIKGSVSQYDENVVRRQADGGIGVHPWITIGRSRDAAASILGLDLTMLRTQDLAVLPGVTSRNAIVILKQGRGTDGDASIKKFGVNFTFTLSQSEGSSQALRTLVELAAIELMGRLTKTPYWSCLGGDVTRSDDVKREVSDWFHAMAASRLELIGWFQHQLRRRGFYEGPIDGQFNDALDKAISMYRERLGLSPTALLDEAFFAAFLAADHAKIERPAEPARVAAAAPAPGRPRDAGPLKLAVTAARPVHAARAPGAGDALNFRVQASRDAHTYCYLQDEQSRVLRVFPNRFVKDSLVSAGKPLELPGRMGFHIKAAAKPGRQSLTCFATTRDISAQLPAELIAKDLEALNVQSVDQLRGAFAEAAGGAVIQGETHVASR